jgi:hypothetical protein
VLRLRFSDRTVLQAEFSPKESVGKVAETLRMCLRRPDFKFDLGAATAERERVELGWSDGVAVSPPTPLSNPDDTLEHIGLVPNGKINVREKGASRLRLCPPPLFWGRWGGW